MALVGEPSGLRPTPAHKGYVEFRVTAEAPTRPASPLPLWSLTFTGRAAHSSQTHVGASANDACLDLLGSLAGTRTDGQPVEVVGIEGGDLVNKVAATCRLVLCAAEPPDVSRVGEVAVEVSPLEPDASRRASSRPTSPAPAAAHPRGDALAGRRAARRRSSRASSHRGAPSTTASCSVAPGRLDYVVDVRSVPAGRPGAALDDYERRLNESCARSGCTIEVRRLLEAAPFRAADDSTTLAALTETLRFLGLPTDTELKSGTTEAPVYQAAGMDVVVFGPGEATGNIHRPNEQRARCAARAGGRRVRRRHPTPVRRRRPGLREEGSVGRASRSHLRTVVTS